MLKLPVPPKSRISHQLTCVSCQEQFAISEDDPFRRYTLGNNWLSPISNSSDIQLHYQADRTRRTVLPETRASVQRNAFHTWNERRRESICCPRCGADNRTWLNILNPPDLDSTQLISFLSFQEIRVWRQRFPAAFFGIVASLIFIALGWVFAYLTEMPSHRAVILLIFVFAAAVLPAAELTKQKNWLDLREDWHLRRVGHTARAKKEATLWLRGIALVVISAFVVPVIIFLGGPRAMSFLVDVLNLEPAAIIENAAAPYIILLNEHLTEGPQEVTELTRRTINILEEIPYSNDPAIESVLNDFQQDLEEILQGLADSTQPDTIRQIANLQAVVDEAIRDVNNRQTQEVQKVIAEAGGTIAFLALWVMIVSLSGLLSMFTSMAAIKYFVSQIDRQLPPPIFYSVANMTRVVVWEAKRALEIGDEVERMQWTAVQRNDRGGITLLGINRDDSQSTQQSDPLTTKVLAQRYEIISDRWGQIIEANINTTRVLRQPGRDRQIEISLGEELFKPIVKQPAERVRP